MSDYYGGMRVFTVLLCLLPLTACSSEPKETSKAPQPQPEPRTGRLAIQSTYPTARGWAPDCELISARSLHLQSRPDGEGKAYAWEVTYVSARLAASRSFLWSSVEAEGLHEGVFPGPPRNWRPGSEPTIAMSALKTDTPQALETATGNAKPYLGKPGDNPPVTFMLEYMPRYAAPVWRVMWGLTPGTSEFSVFVDAATGRVRGRG